MEQINTWIKGLDTDSSFLKISNDRYISLEGGIVVTNSGQSTGAIETERGTKEIFKIPAVPAIFKIQFNKELLTSFPTFITVEFETESSTVVLNEIQSIKDIYDKLISDIILESLILQEDLRIDYSLEYNNITIWVNEAADDLSIFTDAPYLSVKKINAVKNPVIIGSGMFKNNLILCTCNQDNTFSNGQFWNIPINNKTGLIDNLSDGELVPFTHLVYSEQLNLSTEYYLTKLICNPETNDIGRIYWNDRNSPIGSLNILSDFPMNTPLELISGGGQAFFGEIIPRKIINGGFISTGSVVQYFYRLRSSSGGTTSPVSLGSNLIPLSGYNSTDSSDNATYEGSEFLTAENAETENFFKSIELELTNLDSNYQFVELIYSFYGQLETPEFYKVAELPIPQNGTITYIHDGNPENFINIPAAEINGRVVNIVKANDVCVKDNRLLAFGVETAIAELNFDTRIYRFKSVNEEDGQTSKLLDDDLGTIILNGQDPDWDSVPLNHNAINPYNDESDESFWYNFSQYKYQKDGVTLGAEGKNLKMRFTTLKLIGEEDLSINRTSPPFMYSGRYPDATVIDFGNNVTYDLSNEFKDFRSPKIHSFAKGYAREEIYRVFFNAVDKQGNPFYASWVGDIKMPYEWDIASYISEGSNFFNSQSTSKFIVGKENDGELELYSLGMEFDVSNLNKISDQISGYYFSVVKRTDENKTKLAHGLVSPTFEILEGGTEDEINYVEAPRNSSKLHFDDFGVLGNFQIVSSISDSTNIAGTVPYRISSFRSIDDYIKDKAFKYLDADFIHPSSVYRATTEQSLLVGPTGGDSGRAYARKILANVYQDTHFSNSRIPLKDSIWRDLSDLITFNDLNGLENEPTPIGISSGEIYIMASDYNKFNQLSLPDDTDGVVGMEGIYRFTRSRILYHDSFKLNYNPTNPESGLIDLSPDENRLYMVGSYKRILNNQYGGSSYEDRQNNIAHPVTPFIKLDNGVSQMKVKVFGGDTCVSYYPFWTCQRQVNDDTEIGGNYRQANFVTYAITESEINPFYAHGIQWFLDELTTTQFFQSASNLNDKFPLLYNEESFMDYNKVYLQKNDSKISVPKPSLTRDSNVFPSGIFISDLKINGDRIDSWQNFKLDNYKEVDNIYGAINFADNFNDKVIFIQERALGIQSINERALSFNDETGTQIVLGNGDLLGDHGYISTRSGTHHNSSVVQSDFGLYYYDSLQNKIKKFDFQSNNPLSDMYGLFSWLEKNISPLGLSNLNIPIIGSGVVASVNQQTNRVFFTFLGDNDYSVCINESMQSAEYFPYVHPNLYIPTNNSLLVANPSDLQDVHILNKGEYNNYFGNNNPLRIKFIVNTPPHLEKVLTNLLWKSECYSINGSDVFQESINQIRVYNNYQDTNYRSLSEIKRVMRQWGHKVWFNQNSDRKIDRMRNEWHIVELVFNNTKGERNRRLILHDVISKMQTSHSGLGNY